MARNAPAKFSRKRRGVEPPSPSASRPAVSSPRPKAPPPAPPSRGPGNGGSPGWGWWALGLAILTVLVYLPALSNDLVNWDDHENITKNPNLQAINAVSLGRMFHWDHGAVLGNYNPLPILTFALEKALAGEFDTTLIHLNNVLLHALVVALFFRWLLVLGWTRGGALLAALLAGLHPMRVESVAWATERKDVLFAVFYVWALILYVRWCRQGGAWRYAALVGLAVLSGLAKVQAVSLPLSMLAVDWWLERPLHWRRILEKTPFWLISLVIGLINLHTLRQAGSISDDLTHYGAMDRLCIGAWSFLVYLYKLVIPYPLQALYPYQKPLPFWVYLAPFGFALVWALVWLAWYTGRRVWVWGLGFFFVNVMFVLQVLGAGQGYLADRFTYVPYLGLMAIAGYYFGEALRVPARRLGAIALAGAVLATHGILTLRQIPIWRNGETLWTHVIRYESDNSLPFRNRGHFYRDLGLFEKALADYSRALAIPPLTAEVYNGRGKTYFDWAMSGLAGERREDYLRRAAADLEAGLAHGTRNRLNRAEMAVNLGAVYAALGEHDLALRHLNEGLADDPDRESGFANRALLHIHRQRFAEAIEDFNRCLELNPQRLDYWYERGMLRRVLRQSPEALSDLDRALSLNPAHGLSHLERARVLRQLNRPEEAREHYRKAAQQGVAIDPREFPGP